MAQEGVHLISETIVTIGGVGITNSVMGSFLVTVILVLFALIARSSFGVVPSKIQVALEAILLNFYEPLKKELHSEKRAKRYVPYFLTLFFFILLCNQFFMIPFVNAFIVGGHEGHATLFRVPTSDWSLPLTLALLTIISTQVIAFITHPFRHLSHYVRIKGFFHIKSAMDLVFAFVELFLGVLETIAEFARVISLSARLFGNIFAGEVMVLIIAGLFGVFTTYVVPIPFIILGIFAGLVQAYVFAYISMQFMVGTVQAARGAGAH